MKSDCLHQTEKDIEISSEEIMFKKRISESIEAARLQAQAKKVKRYRSAFTTEQINYLEKQFKKCPYIGNTGRKEVADVLNIPERAVKIWFQNRRMKEKKESNIKEPNLDRQNNLINNVVFANDPLDNVHTSTLTNDRIYSSQSPKLNHLEVIKCTKNNDLINKKITSYMKADTTRQDLKTTGNSKELLKDGDSINYNTTFKSSKDTLAHENDNKTKAQNIIGKSEYQEIPEDLSSRNKSVTSSQNVGEPRQGSTYSCVPLYSTQNYYTPCVSAANVMWKPVNVMPVLPSHTLPLAVAGNEIGGLSQINVQGKNCNCDCHMKQSMNYQHANSSAQAQYIFAIPYTSNSNSRATQNVV